MEMIGWMQLDKTIKYFKLTLNHESLFYMLSVVYKYL